MNCLEAGSSTSYGRKDKIHVNIATDYALKHSSKYEMNSFTYKAPKTQVIHAMEYDKMRSSLKAADIVISPDVSDIGTFGFEKREEAITRGYRAARDILPQLQEMLRCSNDTGKKLAQNYQRATVV